MFKFLESFLAAEKSIEVALSSTLVFVAYTMKAAVTKPVMFGKPCEGARPQPFYAYCHKPAPNEQEHADSITALSFNATTLATFETPATVEKKVPFRLKA
ncbi:hypothetical protein V5799_025068 [Amblyomma americanum]|uniref:Uncharacterized protein n=1 Tax=Amblyomma americanum TaxID=6943 RepID=A0AAQ4EAP3_AMBAM